MNARIDKVKQNVSKAYAVALALEDAMGHFYLEREQLDAFETLQNLLYVLQDEIELVKGDIEDLEHDSLVVDVIQAVAEVRKK